MIWVSFESSRPDLEEKESKVRKVVFFKKRDLAKLLLNLVVSTGGFATPKLNR